MSKDKIEAETTAIEDPRTSPVAMLAYRAVKPKVGGTLTPEQVMIINTTLDVALIRLYTQLDTLGVHNSATSRTADLIHVSDVHKALEAGGLPRPA